MNPVAFAKKCLRVRIVGDEGRALGTNKALYEHVKNVRIKTKLMLKWDAERKAEKEAWEKRYHGVDVEQIKLELDSDSDSDNFMTDSELHAWQVGQMYKYILKHPF